MRESLPNGHHTDQARPAISHVNLMVDTLIANASIEDLRAIVRATLATGPPTTGTALLGAARHRLGQARQIQECHLDGLFQGQSDGTPVPTSELHSLLTRGRALYGAGLGFASLRLLAQPVRATVPLSWEEGSEMENALAEVDMDISQALQSCREELDGGRVEDMETARYALADLKYAITKSKVAVETWGGTFPFGQAALALEFWIL